MKKIIEFLTVILIAMLISCNGNIKEPEDNKVDNSEQTGGNTQEDNTSGSNGSYFDGGEYYFTERSMTTNVEMTYTWRIGDEVEVIPELAGNVTIENFKSAGLSDLVYYIGEISLHTTTDTGPDITYTISCPVFLATASTSAEPKYTGISYIEAQANEIGAKYYIVEDEGPLYVVTKTGASYNDYTAKLEDGFVEPETGMTAEQAAAIAAGFAETIEATINGSFLMTNVNDGINTQMQILVIPSTTSGLMTPSYPATEKHWIKK